MSLAQMSKAAPQHSGFSAYLPSHLSAMLWADRRLLLWAPSCCCCCCCCCCCGDWCCRRMGLLSASGKARTMAADGSSGTPQQRSTPRLILPSPSSAADAIWARHSATTASVRSAVSRVLL